MATVPAPIAPPVNPLGKDSNMLARMEQDLLDKCTATLTDNNVSAGVYGVYSLDELETKTEADLCNKIAVGVGYAGCEPWESAKYQNPAQQQAAKMLGFSFIVMLAVPQGDFCQDREIASKLLTMLRKKIFGSPVSGDMTSRTWALVKESPNISIATDTMLYYSQLWVLPLPATSA